jgi:hypothetical protein
MTNPRPLVDPGIASKISDVCGCHSHLRFVEFCRVLADDSLSPQTATLRYAANVIPVPSAEIMINVHEKENWPWWIDKGSLKGVGG